LTLVLLTNAREYAGPGALAALLQDGHTVVCHDASFVAPPARAAFEQEFGATHALEVQKPEAIHAAVMARWGVPRCPRLE